ncbi:MAG: hypothetical protein DA330_10135 [Nitrososphaera sp.]|nr:hypothetical protein [Nitrososphaera sp.]
MKAKLQSEITACERTNLPNERLIQWLAEIAQASTRKTLIRIESQVSDYYFKQYGSVLNPKHKFDGRTSDKRTHSNKDANELQCNALHLLFPEWQKMP